MMEKLLLSESARASKLRRELSAKPSKTKIVVHINNYILPNEDLTTTSTNNHSMATTRENTDIFELDFPKTELIPKILSKMSYVIISPYPSV